MLFVGDDWAEDHHDVEIVDGTGKRSRTYWWKPTSRRAAAARPPLKSSADARSVPR